MQEAHRRLSRHAVTLARLALGLATHGLTVADAYADALAGGSPESWSLFVIAAADLVRQSAPLVSILALTGREREAYEYFVQIVRENDDLLAAKRFVAA